MKRPRRTLRPSRTSAATAANSFIDTDSFSIRLLLRDGASAGALAGDHGARRRQQNAKIRAEGARLRVADVHAHHLIEGRAASSLDLPQSGQTGLRAGDALPMPGAVLLEFVMQRRTGTDQRHVAAKH